MFSILRPYIFSLDPEAAHDLAIKSLKANILPKSFFTVEDEELLETQLFNQKIPNPIGLAAGFDKSAEVYNSLFKFGFGFIEVGTVTPKRQLGNPKPRIFRLEKDQALINRLGFNNHGSEAVSKRISNDLPSGFLGINIGPNKETKNKDNENNAKQSILSVLDIVKKIFILKNGKYNFKKMLDYIKYFREEHWIHQVFTVILIILAISLRLLIESIGLSYLIPKQFKR